MTTVVTPIPARLKNVSHNDPYVAGVEDIIDDNKHKTQSEINTEYDNILSERVADKPATTGTTGDYPYNGMGRVELAKNMVNTGTELAPVMVNTLTQDMFYKGAVGSRVPNTNTIFVIRYDYVLGEDITIPANCVLEFDGGSISNGTISGNNTGIEAGLVKIFDTNISFLGSFEGVSNAEWFGLVYDDSTYDNIPAIQKAIELASYTLSKEVRVNGGIIYLDVKNEGESVASMNIGKLQLFSGCSFIMAPDTVLKVIPTDYRGYNVLSVVGKENVTIQGGSIIGDVVDHLESDGEWGYGIAVFGSKNVTIRDITVADCWGDGIIVNGLEVANSSPKEYTAFCENIFIENVILDKCRRNNISIAGVTNCVLRNSIIKNAGRTNGLAGTMFGIDFEGDYNGVEKAYHIVVENTLFDNNASLPLRILSIYDSTNDVFDFNDVIIRNCDFINGFAVQLEGRNIQFISNNQDGNLYINKCDGCIVDKNRIDRIGVYDSTSLDIVCKNIIITNNKIWNVDTYKVPFNLETETESITIRNNSIKFIKKPSGEQTKLFDLSATPSTKIFTFENCDFEFIGTSKVYLTNPLNYILKDCKFIGFHADDYILGSFYENGTLRITYSTASPIVVGIVQRGITKGGLLKITCDNYPYYLDISSISPVFNDDNFNYFNANTVFGRFYNRNLGSYNKGYYLYFEKRGSSNDKTICIECDGFIVDDIKTTTTTGNKYLRSSLISAFSQITTSGTDYTYETGEWFKLPVLNDFIKVNRNKQLREQGNLIANDMDAVNTALPSPQSYSLEGLTIFVKSLSKNIIWNGTTWVDATGATV